jgi:hypothetical protein
MSETEAEAKKQELIASLLDAAQLAIVSKDPLKAMKGRFARDCAVPIVHWLMDEAERIYGDDFVGGLAVKERRHMEAETDLAMILMESLGFTAGNFLKGMFQPGTGREAAAAALISLFSSAFAKQMRDNKSGATP